MDKNVEKFENDNEKQAQRYKKIPVPTQYREGAKILKAIVEEGKSLKELVYNNKHIVSQSQINHFKSHWILFLENWKYNCTFRKDTSK